MTDRAAQHIEEEYQRAMRMQVQAREAELRVRELLELADERRRQEAQDIRKWNRVLDRIEVALDATKARQAACEQEIERQRRRAERRGVELSSILFDIESDEHQCSDEAVNGSGKLHAIERHMTDDAISLAAQGLSDYAATFACSGDDKKEFPIKIERNSNSKIEHSTPEQESRTSSPAARKLPEARVPQITAEERRIRGRLRIAIDKMAMRHYDALSMSEVDLLLDSYASAFEHSASEPQGLRMAELFSGFLAHMQKRLDRWQQWIESRQDNLPL